eukprot:TRINITY_DN4980_c0_g1_i1.p1 TRINITY_DN4980_c0_g1~~TRINITY_DN4980_c0_g1_i1.p1  ORF type:complete len:498 (+),score=86.94 TRINITY_DN4980_c0_g1_i1:71-1564(+)
MIEYEFGRWGVGFIFSISGSVFPRAMAWALPAGLLTVMYCQLFRRMWSLSTDYPDMGGTSFTIVWGGYTFIVGFLLVFRTQIAFARFWEGARVLWYVKGVWLNATSNSLAFTTTDAKKTREANAFQHLLVRLMSMLYSAALESVSTDDRFDVATLCADGMSADHLAYLAIADDKAEVLLNWVQRALVQNYHNGVLAIPPPILSRVFQELGNGITEVQAARRVVQVPFPFPYAQAISLFLVIYAMTVPLMAAFFIKQEGAAALMSFCTIFAVWCINYIAAELEMPFGADPNDLPLSNLEKEFNDGLQMLMHPLTKAAPTFSYDAERHEELQVVRRTVNGGRLSRRSSRLRARESVASIIPPTQPPRPATSSEAGSPSAPSFKSVSVDIKPLPLPPRVAEDETEPALKQEPGAPLGIESCEDALPSTASEERPLGRRALGAKDDAKANTMHEEAISGESAISRPNLEERHVRFIPELGQEASDIVIVSAGRIRDAHRSI